MSDYITLNKANWDERAPLHAASSDYETQALVDEYEKVKDALNEMIA